MNEKIKIGGREYPYISVQTLVVGSGAAGLNAAVSLYKEGQMDIAVLTEGRGMGTSLNTGSDKQTYYKLTTSGSDGDSVRKMAQVLFDGQSMDGDLALCEAAYSLRGFFHLVDIGVPFPSNGFGEYVGYKTDHDPNQRGTSAGPLTSHFMTKALWKEVEKDQITVFDGYQVIEILTSGDGEDKRACGVIALNLRQQEMENAFTVFGSENIIYAVGGEAGMYETSVYPVSQTGGIGTALRAGVRGKNLTESQYGIASIQFRWNLSGTYQQVLPCYFSTDAEGNDRREFLEDYFEDPQKLLNAIFLKGYQWPFDPRKTVNFGSSLIDLLVYQETVLKNRRVFLDYQVNPHSAIRDGHFEPSILGEEAYTYLANSDGLAETPIQRLEQMNPGAIELYRSHGIDLYTEPLEIAVCAQHNNGGLTGNCWWESNLRHLFPVGEVNGTHGVYRPGGSALNSGQVGSLRAAQFIAHMYTQDAPKAEIILSSCEKQMEEAISFGLQAIGREGQPFDYVQQKKELGHRMSSYGANIRSQENVQLALKENQVQQAGLEKFKVSSIGELKNYYRLRDLLVSQQTYLYAIGNYIAQGGTSRGSYLIYDPQGSKPLECLDERFRFSLEEKGLGQKIQEVSYQNGINTSFWRAVRPMPEDDNWFEKVWRDYRENKIYQEAGL